MKVHRIPRERRHTLNFLTEAQHTAAVFLDTEVDATRIVRHRTESRAAGKRFALVSYVVQAAARAIAQHPRANSSVGGPRPARMAEHCAVDVKLAFDKRLGTERIVVSGLLPAADRATLAEIQERVDHLKAADAATAPEFAGMRAMHRLPAPVGRALFRVMAGSPRRRHRVLGTLAVSSLGHGVVDGFYSVGGTTITVGVGRVLERPVVRDGEIVAAPVLRLNLAFDHRVIDGAEAADLLAGIRDALENAEHLAEVPNPPADDPPADDPSVPVRAEAEVATP